jgi:uncharacterized protein YdhG (YjbR/CyaY superfamily)
MRKLNNKVQKSNSVDDYIAGAPLESRGKLKEMRATIRAVAPDALESISYGMPGYDKGRIAWFALGKRYVGLYLRPPIIKDLQKELAIYTTTKSAIHFPLDKKLPILLIKKLLRARIKKNKEKKH